MVRRRGSKSGTGRIENTISGASDRVEYLHVVPDVLGLLTRTYIEQMTGGFVDYDI